MKLLIFTQKVDKNDSVLGFFHRWIEVFAEQCESVLVICLEKGKYELPSNVTVLSLGKEDGKTRLQYIFQFYKYIFQQKNNYDTVFVHMNPEYVLLGGLFWKIFRKKLSLWYVHRNVDFKLKMATLFVDKIFTVTTSSFSLQSKKVIAVGHGIDTEYFLPAEIQTKNKKFNILSVGRITRIKKLEDAVSAIALLGQDLQQKLSVKFIGGTVTEEDEKYKNELEVLIQEKNLTSVIELCGSVSYSNIRQLYWGTDLCLNLAPTGGIDKAVLESLSCGVPTLFRNQAFLSFAKKYQDTLFFQSVEELSKKIEYFVVGPVTGSSEEFHSLVQKNHDLKQLIEKIMNALTKDLSLR